jgi:anti-anti-sigma regulatory factor
MSVEECNGSEPTVIALKGVLDGACAGELREVTERVARSETAVVIEMSEVTDVATPVVGVLVSAWHSLNDRLTLHCSEPVAAALAENGLIRLLPVD